MLKLKLKGYKEINVNVPHSVFNNSNNDLTRADVLELPGRGLSTGKGTPVDHLYRGGGGGIAEAIRRDIETTPAQLVSQHPIHLA